MNEFIDKAMTYAGYLDLIDSLLAKGETTGTKQSDAMFGYGKINRQRMDRLQKSVILDVRVRDAARSVERSMIWLILTEGWCGDAAQNLPIIEKIAAENANIETRYLLRDENLGLMDRFLTAGARSIPKLIAIDATSSEVLGTWGSRPKAAQELYMHLKEQGVEKLLIMENMQRWYNADKSHSLQAEFETLVKNWNGQNLSAAKA